MRQLLTALVMGLMLTVAASAQAEDTVNNDLALAQLGVEGMTLVSDAEGETIRGKSGRKGGHGKKHSGGGSGNTPLVQLDLENLVLVNLNLATATTVFVQTDLAVDLNVLVFNGINLQVGNVVP